jgi:hypothetical protein
LTYWPRADDVARQRWLMADETGTPPSRRPAAANHTDRVTKSHLHASEAACMELIEELAPRAIKDRDAYSASLQQSR